MLSSRFTEDEAGELPELRRVDALGEQVGDAVIAGEHINARMQYADPDGDAKLRNADEVEQEAAEWQQKAERVHNEWYNQRKRRPQEFGV